MLRKIWQSHAIFSMPHGSTPVFVFTSTRYTVVYVISRIIHVCLEIPDLFLVLNMISHSFAALTREISRSTLEINLVFPRIRVYITIHTIHVEQGVWFNFIKCGRKSLHAWCVKANKNVRFSWQLQENWRGLGTVVSKAFSLNGG